MKRQIYSLLVNWKNSSPRKPLVLRGARQVGKTYLLQQFAQNEFKDSLYVNFEEEPEVKAFFNDSLAPEGIIKNLSLFYNKPVTEKDTLIFFDEIQACPNALTSLKYFCEKYQHGFVVSAGSLLGVKFNTRGSFPVGKVNFQELYPLTFTEFLVALGKEDLANHLLEINDYNHIQKPIHEKLLKLLRIYFFVGGMPEAVETYRQSDDLMKVQKIHHDIKESYLLDFIKHAPKSDIQKINIIWDQIPNQLAKENKKFVFSKIEKSARSREYENAIEWLADAGLIYLSKSINVPKIPINSYTDNKGFKMFLFDIGLLGSMSSLPANAILKENVKFFSEFKGALVENYVAQTLKAKAQSDLFYWTSSSTAEVDFIVTKDTEVYPLEVKAGASTKTKSLNFYDKKYNPKYLLRTNTLNLDKNEKTINLPLYLIERITDFI